MVCPMISAWELHQRLPASQLRIIADAGHAGFPLEPQQRDMPLSLDLFICHCAHPAHARANPPTHRRTCTHHSIPSLGLTATSVLILTARLSGNARSRPFSTVLRFCDAQWSRSSRHTHVSCVRTGNEPGILRELVKATDSFRPAA